ncbi:ankyrin [Nemania sp. FL0916]|nr:ankyrin [Nemania sp. FL0916]
MSLPQSSQATVKEQTEAVRRDEERQWFLLAKNQLRQGLSASEINELEQIARRKQAKLDDECALLEAPFAHLPPLPAALPMYSHHTTAFSSSEMTFFTWCIDGEQDAVEEYIESQEGHASQAVLQRGLDSACKGGRAQVASYLLGKGTQLHDSAIKYASERGDLALFEAFLDHGWNPNQQVPGGFGVALPHCTNDPQIVKLLLTHGAEPNLGRFDIRKISGLGLTPPMDRKSGAALTAAAQSGNIEVIDMLLQHGAVLEWSTPLHGALCDPKAWSRNRAAFVHLLRLGADPSKRITFKCCNLWEIGDPLWWALRGGNWDAVELLLEAGADPEGGYASAKYIDEHMSWGKVRVDKLELEHSGISEESLTWREAFVAVNNKVKRKKKEARQKELNWTNESLILGIGA